MTKKEIEDYYNIKTNRQYGWVLRYFKNNNICETDVIIGKDFIGLLDSKNNKPFSKSRTVTNYTCLDCKRVINIPYKQWEKLSDKKLCGSCIRSKNLTLLNKTIIRDNNERVWDETTERGCKLRVEAKERRSYYNKNIQNNVIKSFSKEKKQEIKISKINTWLLRPFEERNEINKKRDPRQYMSECELQDFNNRVSITGKQNSTIHSEYKIKWWASLTPYEKIFHIENMWSVSKIKKQHDNFDLYYQGQYEKKFLDICFSNELQVQRGPNIEYYDPDKKRIRIYMCDFIVNNYLVEIKSEWWWKYHYKINKIKQNVADVYAKENGYKAYVLYILENINKDIDIERIKD